MVTEVWFRNPWNYIRELVEVGECWVAWDRGLLIKKGIDPIKHAQLYFANAFPYRILCIGTQGSPEYRPGDKIDKPTAVYPTWAYGEDVEILENMLEHPYGEDAEACSDTTVPGDERPVWGQEHRVVITEVPNTTKGPGRQFIRFLKDLQDDYPKAIIHLHGTYGYKFAFGLGFGAADIEPRTTAQKGRIHLPAGSIEPYERMVNKPQWAAAMGFKPSDLADPKNRCKYNIKSAKWAGAHYTELYKFRTQRSDPSVDIESSNDDFKAQETLSYKTTNKSLIRPGDQKLCDTCSLQNNCKYFRSGAVCTVPGAEPARLAQMFNTRDADHIIDGLGTLLAANTNRLERGMRYEEVDGEIDPEVSKILNQIFNQGVQLAKLLDPGRFSTGAKVEVNVGAGGAAEVSMANPRQLVSKVVRELERSGIPRNKITPDLIKQTLSGMIDPEKAAKSIEGTVIAEKEER